MQPPAIPTLAWQARAAALRRLPRRAETGAARLRCAVAAAAVLCLSAPLDVARAGGAATWSEPQTLWTTDSAQTFPAPAADPYGRVHVFWQERADRDAAGELSDVIYHRMWDGRAWTGPTVVLSKPAGSTSISHVRPLASPGGEIYLVWLDGKGVYFSRAAAVDAADARAWEEPRRLAEASHALQLDVALHGEGDVYAAFTDIAPKGGAAPLLFVESHDGGDSWSEPQAIVAWTSRQDSVAAQPALAADAAGAVHVVWDERSGPNWLGDRILFASRPAGAPAWSAPQVLDDDTGQPQGYRVTIASLAATADGELHATWACGKPPGRCYRRRSAAGAWSQIEHPFGALVSVAGWDRLRADDEGNLHFVAQLRTPKGIYYATRPRQGAWSQPLLLDSAESGADPHFPNVALAYGNQIFVVWQKRSQQGDIVFATLRTAAAPLPPSPFPPAGARPQRRRRGAWRSFAAAAILVATAVVLWLRRARRRRDEAKPGQVT